MRSSCAVSGGGGAIGRSIATRLAGEGADVAVLDLDLAAAEAVATDVRALGVRASAHAGDIRGYETVRTCIDGIADAMGGIDIVVNSAGGSARSRMDLFEKIDIGVFDWMIDVNLRGPMYVIHAALPHLIRRNRGKIVNIASIVALGGKAKCVDYAAAKGAIDSMTLGLAKEVAGEGIRVNAVRPGVVHTEIHASGGEPDRVERVKASVPMGRGGQAEEIAEAILWLASEQASYTSGALLDVSGGR
jgi:NAD(P)-dependent dehydrogenase (short-subunit alcohol dehydrogenase family)